MYCISLQCVIFLSTGADMLPLTARLQAKGLSDRKAGPLVRAAWTKRDPRVNAPTAAAIAAKIGLLRKGHDTWWRNRRHALAALADVLGCSSDDLLAEGRRHVQEIAFSELPEMKPLLPGQDPAQVMGGGWLGGLVDDAVQRGGLRWLVVPPGGGKSLAIRMLQQRREDNGVVATTVRRLCDAPQLDVPLVLEVEHADPATDASAIAALTSRTTPTCILAAFVPDFIHGAHEVNLSGDWQGEFARWVQRRLTGTKLDAAEVLEWVAEVDPAGALFPTPGDLLPLLAYAHRAGVPSSKVGLGGLARDHVGRLVGASSTPWLRRSGARAVEALVEGRWWADVARQALELETWASVLPVALTPSPDPALLARQVKAKRPVEDLVSAKPVEAIHDLCDIGILRTHRCGRLDVFPTWLGPALEREVVIKAFRASAIDAWALWAVDATRKDIVDQGLDAVAPADLVRNAERVVADERLAAVSATEALFAALGRRSLQTDWQPSPEMVPCLQRLGRRQLELLDRLSQAVAPTLTLPLTRRVGLDQRAELAVWLADAWALSFAVPAPPDVGREAGWRLPGWTSKLRLADAPTDLPTLTMNLSTFSHPWLRNLLRIARRAVAKCVDLEPPAEVADVLLPWVIIDGPARSWALTDAQSYGVFHSGCATLVGELLEQELDDLRTSVVTHLWPAFLKEHGGGDPIYALSARPMGWRRLHELFVRHLPLESFSESLEATNLLDRPRDLPELVAMLPERLRRSALAVAAKQIRAQRRPVFGLGQILERLGPSDIDLLVEFVAERYGGGAIGAKRVWALDPKRALAETRDALRRGEDHEAYAWFESAPEAALDDLLDALADQQSRGDVPWAARWLATVMSHARTRAPRVFAMLCGSAGT